MQPTSIQPGFINDSTYQYLPASEFPTIHPVWWLQSHFAVGGWSPLQRLSGMLTAHMTRIAPQAGFAWHPHRGLEIYTWILEGRVHHEDTTGGEGDIAAGELQRMFSGEYIEHQELNPWDEPARVIQIWFAVDVEYRGTKPHYQQLSRAELPSRQVGNATVTSLIGDDSPMEQHIKGRLTATTVKAEGKTSLEAPRPGEDLFLYVTDGGGNAQNGTSHLLAQYDVILARPGLSDEVSISAASGEDLQYLSFYLPSFMA